MEKCVSSCCLQSMILTFFGSHTSWVGVLQYLCAAEATFQVSALKSLDKI